MTSKTQTQETFNSFSSFHKSEVMERVEETRRNSPDTFDFGTEFEYEVENPARSRWKTGLSNGSKKAFAGLAMTSIINQIRQKEPEMKFDFTARTSLGECRESIEIDFD